MNNVTNLINALNNNLSIAKMIALSPAVEAHQKRLAKAEVVRISEVIRAIDAAVNDHDRMGALVYLKHNSRKSYDIVVPHINGERAARMVFQKDWSDNSSFVEANDAKWFAMGGSRN